MPNIKVHGLSESAVVDLRQKIARILSDTPLFPLVVITDMRSTVTDLHGAAQPYLEIIVSKEEKRDLSNPALHTLQSLGRLLAPLGMDIELGTIEKFIEKGKSFDLFSEIVLRALRDSPEGKLSEEALRRQTRIKRGLSEILSELTEEGLVTIHRKGDTDITIYLQK